VRNPFKRKPVESIFTGNCLVREFTGDGVSVGCYHSTYNGICPRHGDVTEHFALHNWPRDFELPKYDGSPWAERLREEWRGR
jgi:hypothetical protein